MNAERLVRTTDLALPIGSDNIDLRIEIFQSIGRRSVFKVRVWKYETFRIQSTFPQHDGAPRHAASDELILKEFESFFPTYSSKAEAKDVDQVEEATIRELIDWSHDLAGS